MKFKFSKVVEEDDESKKEKFDKRWNWTKYIFGIYTLGFENKNNKKINSKFLSIFCFLAIVIFIISMIASVSILSYGIYHKINTPANLTISGLGMVLPSLNKDTFKDTLNDSISASNGIVPSTNRRDFIFLPILLLFPIIFILLIVHEFGHYISCRKFGLKVDEYGIGALSIFCIPIVPLGYVKPNEKELNETKKYNYLSMVSAGVFMNFIFSFIFYGLLLLFPSKFLAYLFLLNLGILIFNALPLAILDGGLFVKKLNKTVSFISTAIILILLAILII